MKKLIAIIASLCALTGFSTGVISEVVEVFVESNESIYVKEKAAEVVAEDLEELYDCLVNGENPYSR